VKKFTRSTATTNVTMNLRATAGQLAKVLDPEIYELCIKGARLISSEAGNVSLALDLTEVESDSAVSTRPLWLDGPKAGNGSFAAENQRLLVQLLEAAGEATEGEIQIAVSIKALVGLQIRARLLIASDQRTGQRYNKLIEIINDGAP
jgi:hypothetical protein